jgi:RNA polymerase sigma factor (sigma-70 family)
MVSRPVFTMAEMNKLDGLFVAMRNELARSVLKIVPPDTVEDIVQEAYVRLCQVGDQNSIRHPRAFLFKLVKNLALDHIKSASHRLNIGIEADDLNHPLEDSTYREVVSHEEFGQFCDAVRQLPLQCRRVFVLKKVYNYSQKEISEELSISASTVEKHIALGIRRCRTYLQNQQRGLEDGRAGAKGEIAYFSKGGTQ